MLQNFSCSNTTFDFSELKLLVASGAYASYWNAFLLLAATPPSRENPPWDQADPPGQGDPPDQAGRPPGPGIPPRTRHTPLGRETPREEDCSIRSMSGRYASYWNAFLFVKFLYSIYRIYNRLSTSRKNRRQATNQQNIQCCT